MFYPLESRPKAVELWDAKCAKPLMLYAVFTHVYDVSVHMGEDGIYLYADGVQNAPPTYALPHAKRHLAQRCFRASVPSGMCGKSVIYTMSLGRPMPKYSKPALWRSVGS